MARPQKCRSICSKPRVTRYQPEGGDGGRRVVVGYDEYEVLRLLDFEKYTQQQCAEKMQISRTTVTRMYESVRHKLADMLVSGKGLEIAGGDVTVCPSMKPACIDNPRCCHRRERLPGQENTADTAEKER